MFTPFRYRFYAFKVFSGKFFFYRFRLIFKCFYCKIVLLLNGATDKKSVIRIMQITITNGGVSFDGEEILSEINFSVCDKDRIALVGRNGCGKTTLLKVLSGEVVPETGDGDSPFIFSKSGNPVIGYLKQTFETDDYKTLEDELLSAYSHVLDIEARMEAALKKLEVDGSEKAVKLYSSLSEEFERENGYAYKKEYRVGAKKFGFTESDLSKPLKEFSGGQRTKISLLKLLLSKPDVLLLDEPTNHLDLEAIEWLEKYLANYKKAFVVVSHDRMFLDKTVKTVYEIEYGETKKYQGNYSAFMRQKRADYDKALKDSLIRKKEVERLSALVERFRYKANKAKMAQAKLKQIERIGSTDAPVGFDESTFKASFTPEKESVEKTLVLEEVSFGYDKPLGHINTIVKRGQKLGIIGRNGCGKSTLIKTIMKILPPISGEVKYGLRAEIGYFDQTLTQNFSPLTVFDDFHNDFPALSDGEVRNCLGAFLFSGEDVFKRVGDLSGGEKVRLALCKIFKKKPNVLILDEPTNHMDIIGKDSLEKMLAAYTGTVITVSHDRYFIDKVCDRLAVFENGKLNLYDCGYSEYETLRPDEEEVTVQSVKQPVVKKEKPVSSEKERAKKLHRISVLEEKIAVLEKEKDEIQKLMDSDSTYYSDYEKYSEITKKIAAADEKLSPLMEEWTSLMESL